jgi:hypothetical protein
LAIASGYSRRHGQSNGIAGAQDRRLAEAELYCYSADPGRRRAEIPEDDNNHALGDAAT